MTYTFPPLFNAHCVRLIQNMNVMAPKTFLQVYHEKQYVSEVVEKTEEKKKEKNI